MEEATCEKIIDRISVIINQDPLLDEFDVVFAAGEVNRSPVLHVDHKLGLESWCVKHVYSYAYNKLLTAKRIKRRDPASIQCWTQFCLLVAPEVGTFWNIRKSMLQEGSIKAEIDLHLTKIVLSRKPKCMEVFQHRKWIFLNIKPLNSIIQHSLINNQENIQNHQNGNVNQIDIDYYRRCLWNELELCTYTANKHQNNYHSWNHRLWIVQQFSDNPDIIEVYRQEYEKCHRWISIHVSEHSGMNYFQFVLDSIISTVKEKKIDIKNILPTMTSFEHLYVNELNFNEELIQMYHEHEALFCHRRFLLVRLKELLCPSPPQRTCSPPLEQSPPPVVKRSCVETVNSNWSAVLLSEKNLVGKCLLSMSYQKILGEKHNLWLNNVLGI